MKISPFENIISDVKRLNESSDNSKCSTSKLLKRVFLNPSFYVIVAYRFSSFLYGKKFL